MLIARKHFVPDAAFDWQFVQSPGPGGQNVNKVASAVRLALPLRENPYLDPEFRTQLAEKLAAKLNEAGELVVISHATRSQLLNRRDALEKLAALLEAALTVRKRRRATKPTHASVLRRLETKSRRAAVKKDRAARE